jgi:hypothetical protein
MVFRFQKKQIQPTVAQALLPHLARHLQSKFKVTSFDPATSCNNCGISQWEGPKRWQENSDLIPITTTMDGHLVAVLKA